MTLFEDICLGTVSVVMTLDHLAGLAAKAQVMRQTKKFREDYEKFKAAFLEMKKVMLTNFEVGATIAGMTGWSAAAVMDRWPELERIWKKYFAKGDGSNLPGV